MSGALRQVASDGELNCSFFMYVIDIDVNRMRIVIAPVAACLGSLVVDRQPRSGVAPIVISDQLQNHTNLAAVLSRRIMSLDVCQMCGQILTSRPRSDSDQNTARQGQQLAYELWVACNWPADRIMSAKLRGCDLDSHVVGVVRRISSGMPTPRAERGWNGR
jgi:hypothetical protein